MLNTILAEKVKMSQAFEGDARVPVTLVKAGPCVVTQIKTLENDGYWAVQLGFGDKRTKNTTKPLQGHLKNFIKEKTAPRYLAEVRLDNKPEVKVGDTVKVADILSVGDRLQVTGISKGKGFQGGVKRWGFHGGPKTHGQSDRHRAPGSIGQGTTPGRVYKGKKMAGRMGTDTVSVKNLHVVDINEDKNEIQVSGAVPGRKGTFLVIKKIENGKS